MTNGKKFREIAAREVAKHGGIHLKSREVKMTPVGGIPSGLSLFWCML